MKRRYLSEGLSAALDDPPTYGRPPKITEHIEAKITSIACSDAPGFVQMDFIAY
ncbi:MAG: helix-turn-helix domain-containing protein [Sphingobacteriales bacterium]|nr:helix-turn-helix domain-containing protein [Sphingobacteriales bacterium]